MRRSRLTLVDVFRVGAIGLTARPSRVALSALGIAIGIAAMLAVVGISASSRAELDRTLARLGTNLLAVTPGEHVFGGRAALPVEAVGSAARIRHVQSVSAVGRIDTSVYRTELVPSGQTSSVAVLAARLDLPATVGAGLSQGAWLNEATASHPGVVLGSVAADRLGIRVPGLRLWLGGHWFSVTGILQPVPLAADLDTAALVGWPIAERLLGFDGHPTTVYTRVDIAALEQIRRLLPASVHPEHPEEVRVSRASDALLAKRAADRTLSALLAGLGALSLVVGGLGVANTMVITVLERRQEIGLRRALGATKAHICYQFLTESLLLASIGGLGGIFTGTVVTAWYATARGWPTVVPWWVTVAGAAATAVIGPIAGLYPAVRASRLEPHLALSA